MVAAVKDVVSGAAGAASGLLPGPSAISSLLLSIGIPSTRAKMLHCLLQIKSVTNTTNTMIDHTNKKYSKDT